MTLEFILGTSWVFLGNLHNPLNLSFLNCKVGIIMSLTVFKRMKLSNVHSMFTTVSGINHERFHSCYYYYKTVFYCSKFPCLMPLSEYE